ncbi:MAG: helix-turn-helix domain-containing protein [bacterium]
MGLFRLLFKRTQQELALRLLHEGKSVSAVARAFNVHQATIYRCIKPKTSL